LSTLTYKELDTWKEGRFGGRGRGKGGKKKVGVGGRGNQRPDLVRVQKMRAGG